MKAMTVRSQSPEETLTVGEQLGRLLRPGDVVLLSGDLGTGKTCLAQGIGAGMGIQEPIKSSSFVLLNEYPGNPALYHADLYRLNDPAEVADLALEEYAAPGVLVVEWPDRAWEELPGQHLLIRLSYVGDTTRELTFEAHGERYERLLSDFTRKLALTVRNGRPTHEA